MVAQHVVTGIGLRKRLYGQLEPEGRSKSGLSTLNSFIVFLVLLSFLALALETEETIGPMWRIGIDYLNIAIVAIFAIEYIVRVWVAGEDPRYRGLKGRVRYMMTGYAIADLVAFLPELLWILLTPAGVGDDVLIVLRVLRLARLVKLARFVPAFDVLGATVERAGTQLLTTLAMALALVYVSAVALYFVEGVGGQQQESFASIPRALWWAIATLTTVGYGDVYPVTGLGRIFASVIALAGIGVVALPAGVFASAFSDELREREIKKLKERVEEVETENEELEAENEELEAELETEIDTKKP
ncbi:MAG: ion transporter [Henriciella sp.]|nr:ion transporter [Henriciella sp.]